MSAPSGPFTGCHFRWTALKQGDQFGERSRELVGQGNLTNRRKGGRRGWIQLPKNVEGNLLVKGVIRVPVRVPIGRVAVDLHVPLIKGSVRRGKRSSEEIRPSPMIPKPRMV